MEKTDFQEKKMKRLNLQQLKAEHPDVLIEDKESKENESKLVSQIAKKAKDICEKRRAILPELQKAQIAIDAEISDIESLLNEIHPTDSMQDENEDYLREEFSSPDSIKSICDELTSLLTDAEEYRKNVKDLCELFQYSKIRIVSVGMARSGKSLFTRLYSGIKDKDILRDYGSGDKEDPNQDCTGTICELEHICSDEIPEKWKSQGCMITVYFFSEAEITGTLNDYLDKVYEKVGDANFKELNLPRRISSLALIREKCSKDNANKLERKLTDLGVTEGIIKGLVQYFRNPEYINELLSQSQSAKIMKFGIEIAKDKLRQYRDMTDNQCLYLAVKKIRIQVDMNKKHLGLFDDFVFVDTKGISTNAGQQSNKEAFQAINGSDAVFSIYFAKQGNEDQIGFYTEISNEYHLNKNFVNKHFTIINRDSRVENVNTSSIMDNIESKKLANTCYDGILKVADNKAKDVSYTDDDCNVFANLVILDMLNKIADYVLDFDRERIGTYNLKGKQLGKRIGSLLAMFESLKYERYDPSEQLLNEIPRLYDKVWSDITTKYKTDLDYSSNDSQNDNYSKKRKKDNCIYTLISGEKEHDDSNLSTPDKEITKAIEFLYSSWESAAKMRKLGTTNNAGEYIEFISRKLLEKLNVGILEKINSQKIDVRKIVFELFDSIADTFKLKTILKEQDISKMFGEKRTIPECMHNTFFVKLSDIYDLNFNTSFPDYDYLFTPWEVLLSYVNENSGEERMNYDASIIIKDEQLRKCLIEKVKDLNLEKYFTEIECAKSRARRNCAASVEEFFRLDIEGRDAILNFYKDHNAASVVLDDANLSMRISLTEKWDTFIKLRQKFSELCKKGITEIPLYLIKSEETKTA